MNQLVRGRVDFQGFLDWFNTLAADEQAALAYYLFAYANQAGLTSEDCEAALKASSLAHDEPVAKQAQSFWTDKPAGCPDQEGLRRWLSGLASGDRLLAFKFLAFLFGEAEGRVYRAETKASCNHWWHRDLLDERVVQSLLADPRYAYTSMKDDAATKLKGWLPWQR